MTKDEAEERRIDSMQDQANKWCPLINTKCKRSCECFYKGRIYSIGCDGSSMFNLKKASCDCYALKGGKFV